MMDGVGMSPPSLSVPSLQSVSMTTLHPGPLHPAWQTQRQPLCSRVQRPCPLHSPGQPSERGVSHPGWQMQVPSWHWPCSSQRGWHALWSHAVPIQPSSHWHWPSEQTPWLPHGTGHSSAEQVGGGYA
ncbi:hypothetical protein F7725_009819 [Dissostichus mawsoni]|uniref:Uncharacterized protein n=1 Tax=Dissostichus mawsoni TaxID=36200 RepID=A0A7J5XM52_DISMA|nr:hypothetical protein F7725_009819 [Dissostichus mawsoni]